MTSRAKRSLARLTPVLLLGPALSGCMVGPNFSSPALSPRAGYTAEPLAHYTASAAIAGGQAQRIVSGADVPGRWWTLFKSKQLDALVDRAVANNLDIESARASLRQAQEQVLATQGGLLPSITGSGSAERTRSVQTAGGTGDPYSLYNASVAVSYSIDVFGGTRRSIEAARASAAYQAFEAEAAYLTITSNVATGAIQEASLNEQVRASREIVKAKEEVLKLLKTQAEVGTASQATVLQQQASVAETRATLPPLEKQQAQQRNALATLVGAFPSEYTAKPFVLAMLTLPRNLPLSLPSTLVRQRPDVRAAEAQLHQASAEVGVATADMFPKFALSASLPSTAYEIADFLSGRSIAWSLAAGVTQPIFQGGTLRHKKRAAEAAYDAAAARYRSVVLSAFADVANALRALQADARALQAQLAAESAAAESLKLVRAQYEAGAVDYTNVLTAQQTYESARINRATAQAARYADTVALFQALGGGWWNRDDLPELKTAELGK